MEGQSRGNNLRFNGLQGRFDEDWEVTEEKVRSFIKDEKGMLMHEHVEIEKAHRLKSPSGRQVKTLKSNMISWLLVTRFIAMMMRERLLCSCETIAL